MREERPAGLAFAPPFADVMMVCEGLAVPLLAELTATCCHITS